MKNFIILPNIRTNKSRRMTWVVHMARMGEMRHANKVLVGKPEGKRTLKGERGRILE
jgi:hypothetical protein